MTFLDKHDAEAHYEDLLRVRDGIKERLKVLDKMVKDADKARHELKDEKNPGIK